MISVHTKTIDILVFSNDRNNNLSDNASLHEKIRHQPFTNEQAYRGFSAQYPLKHLPPTETQGVEIGPIFTLPCDTTHSERGLC